MSTADFAVKNTNRSFLMIAIAAGSGAVIGIATSYLYYRYKQQSNDLVCLKEELEAIRKELVKLKEAVERLIPEELLHNNEQGTSKLRRKKERKALCKSTISTVSQASLDTFFDAPSSPSETASAKSDEETVNKKKSTTVSSTESDDISKLSAVDKVIALVDRLQAKGSDEARAQAYTLMQINYPLGKVKSDFLWRFAMCCYLYGQTFLNKDQHKRRSMCQEAQKYAFLALALKENDADVRKWCALTLGIMSDFVSMKQKIEDGHQFKIHIDRALELKPDDAVLFHLKGRWCFGVAALSWFERKVAATLFAKPPEATFDDALQCFIEADRLKHQWLENMLYIVKVHQSKNDRDYVRLWVSKVKDIKAVSSEDTVSKREMEDILRKM